eukprot:4933852-Prymnesium_polylepis.1
MAARSRRQSPGAAQSQMETSHVWNSKCQWATFLAKLHVAVQMYDPTVDVANPSEYGTTIVEY